MKKVFFAISFILFLSPFSGVLAQPSKESDEVFIDLKGEPQPLLPFSEIFYYPTLAKEGGLEGKVVIDALIDTNGNIIKTEIVATSGSELLDYAAVDIIRKQKYRPAIVPNDKKIKCWISVPIVFKLGEEKHTIKGICFATLPKNLSEPLVLKIENYNVTAAKELLATVSVNDDGTVNTVSILPSASPEVVRLVSERINTYRFLSVPKNRGASTMRTAFVRIKIEMN